MSFEESFESPLEQRRRTYEEKVVQLESGIEKIKEGIVRHENSFKELDEVNLILEGLYKKVEELVREDREKHSAVPETEEEWNLWMRGTERILNIYSRIADLEIEFDALINRINGIQDEIDKVQKGIDMI